MDKDKIEWKFVDPVHPDDSKYIIGVDPAKGESKTTFHTSYGYSVKQFDQPKTIFERWFGKYEWYQRWMYKRLIKRIAKYYNMKPSQLFNENI